MSGAQDRWRLGRAAIVVPLAALGVGVVLQGSALLKRVKAMESGVAAVEGWLSCPLSEVPPGLSAVFARRSLPALVERIPADARVLLVSGTPIPAQFHYYFQPRPLVFLQPLEPEHLELAIRNKPDMAEVLRDQFARLERKGWRLTPERLESELGRADWVVVFLRDEPLPGGTPLERVAGDEVATLYRVVRG